MSWTRAAKRTIVRSSSGAGLVARPASTVRIVWSHRSSPGILFWATPRWAARSGAIASRTPLSARRRSPIDGRSARSSFVELHGDPLAGQVADERRGRLDRGEGPRLDRPAERGREPDGPDDPERILLEPLARLADRPDRASDDVRLAAERIDQAWPRPRAIPGDVGSGAPGQGVHREVAPRQIGLERRPELDPVRPPEVGVVVVAPERRDLVLPAATPDRDGPEPVLVCRVVEQRGRLLRERGGGEVPVPFIRSRDRPAGQDVAKAPPTTYAA